MIQYKIEIIPALKEIGINTTIAKENGIFAQATMKKFRDGNANITLDVLNRLCCILKKQPCDIIKYVETPEDKEKIISKISEKPIQGFAVEKRNKIEEKISHDKGRQ